MRDWDTHTVEVEKSAVVLPDTVTALLSRLEKTSPLAALRAARRLEVTAVQVGYWPAHDPVMKRTQDAAYLPHDKRNHA